MHSDHPLPYLGGGGVPITNFAPGTLLLRVQSCHQVGRHCQCLHGEDVVPKHVGYLSSQKVIASLSIAWWEIEPTPSLHDCMEKMLLQIMEDVYPPNMASTYLISHMVGVRTHTCCICLVLLIIRAGIRSDRRCRLLNNQLLIMSSGCCSEVSSILGGRGTGGGGSLSMRIHD